MAPPDTKPRRHKEAQLSPRSRSSKAKQGQARPGADITTGTATRHPARLEHKTNMLPRHISELQARDSALTRRPPSAVLVPFGVHVEL